MKKRCMALVLAAMMSVSALAGCGNSGDTAAGSGSAAQESTEAPQKTEAVGKDVEAATELSDNEIKVGFGTAIDSLTPFRAQTARNAPYFIQLYETLAVLDENKELQPYVAKSWETADNGFSYDVEILDTVTDSEGNQITASDVVWFINESMTRALKPIFSKIQSVEETGDYTFKITLNSNVVGTIEAILQDTYIVSEKAFEASSDEFGTSAVTTSPYACTEFTPSASLSFERRDDYWQDISNLPECVRPVQKKVSYSIITEASQLGIALETGEIDMAIDIASSTGTQFVDNSDYNVSLQDGPQGWQLFFSGAEGRAVADNEKLRQAICYAIDADGLVSGLSLGYGSQMYDVASPRLIGFDESWKDEEYYTYDVEKAQQLLQESGYNGETLTILGTSSAFSSRLGQLIQNYLVAIGINVELNSVDMALYTASRLDGTQYDMVLGTVGGSYLPDFWSIRFDPAAYPAGDATSRNDQELADLLYKTWTVDGYTSENINEVHNYIKDHAYGYGLVNPQVFSIWRSDLNLVKEVDGGISGYVVPSACQIRGN